MHRGSTLSVVDWRNPEKGERTLFVMLRESEGVYPWEPWQPYTVLVESDGVGGVKHAVANALYLGSAMPPFALDAVKHEAPPSKKRQSPRVYERPQECTIS